ncbi:hypothetical protein [Verrucosispora sp. TAA-831]|uniref:hypothetical protein n=1 Tax=Verrucosispora sp. TAA-831 TaxID=3422227 RepID=UPI003D6F4D61
MPGQPQLREALWLYLGDNIPYALVRVGERMDGSGMWDVLVNHPAGNPTEQVERPDEQSARAEAARRRDEIAALYRDQHGVVGEWRTSY